MSKWILIIIDSHIHELCNDIHFLIEKSEIQSQLLYTEKQELMVLQKFDLSTCRGLSRQLQEFNLRRIRIFSKFDVLHVFKARMVEASFLHRSF